MPSVLPPRGLTCPRTDGIIAKRVTHTWMGGVFSSTTTMYNRSPIGTVSAKHGIAPIQCTPRSTLNAPYGTSALRVSQPDCAVVAPKRDVHRRVFWGLYGCRQSLFLCMNTARMIVVPVVVLIVPATYCTSWSIKYNSGLTSILLLLSVQYLGELEV